MTQALLRVYINSINRIIMPMLACASAVIVFLYGKPAGPSLSAALLISAMGITIIFSFIFVRRFHANRGDRVLIGMYCVMLGICFLMVAAEILLHQAGSPLAGFVITYVSPLCILIFHGILSRAYMMQTIKMDQLYESLKENVNRNRDVQITETSEEKLKRVINFVNENFTSDIAREGLAAAVDLHPDYMSRIFRVYTGVKINEYITDLRIKQAAERLRATDQKIIDIALSTGFESLTTFNRSFKKLTGESPTDFRKSHRINDI